ncbi:hypothetical protein O6H91_13G093200 [Diphasiastrum complanatum]|uniref:Uncharacterized protein n=1 Tax=Diphasiastrum complanatum TaxID=34168 RepID=A0ACC2BXD9_DIPCM|nr:hypothetical protein O6H91_13G093200 [Diphasiastrum complanatum]
MAVLSTSKKLLLLLTIVLLALASISHGSLPLTEIKVGGEFGWKYGVNYTEWAMNTAPFYVGDSLGFYYKNSSLGNFTIYHNVHLLRDFEHFLNCDFSDSYEVADSSQGEGGFEFILSELRPYFFACDAGEGFHCRNGPMKLLVMPILRSWIPFVPCKPDNSTDLV